MSHRPVSVRTRLQRRLRGLAVVGLAAATALPLLVATGGSRTSSVESVLALARAQVGDAYAWGGNGPDAWDCSGLTSYVWREAAGVVLPRVSAEQQRWAVPVPREQLLPGDLVFYGDPVNHVALYAGDGRVVDASSAKKGVVERGLWTAPVVRYGRVPREGMPEVQPWTPPTPSASPSAEPAPASSEGAGPAEDTTATPAGSGSATTSASPSASASPSTSASASPRPSARSTATAAVPAQAGLAPAARPATPRATPTPTRAASTPAGTAAARPAPVKTRPAQTSAPAPARAGSAPSAVRPLPGLPARQTAPSSAVALKAVAGARSVVGVRTSTDVGLVRDAWRHAGGGLLPATRAALVARAVEVARPQLRVGDLVTYGRPSSQVYLYIGSGYMVGHSKQHGAVVVRRVHTGDVRFARLPVAGR